jgi:hypothetical protein
MYNRKYTLEALYANLAVGEKEDLRRTSTYQFRSYLVHHVLKSRSKEEEILCLTRRRWSSAKTKRRWREEVLWPLKEEELNHDEGSLALEEKGKEDVAGAV